MNNLGIVVIGRNEGDRLIRCLKSIVNEHPENETIVYVDSGSSDNSVPFAKSLGINVIELDLSIPFTMARGRNTGFEYLVKNYPNIHYVQFIDGDCELIPNWLDNAVKVMESDPQIAVVCGRRRERFPDNSIYNLLVDMEWNTPSGETNACGGDSLMKVKAVQQVSGFNPDLICGEEPEMCIRLRQKHWKILRIDAEMTLHDAAILKFEQWWKRTMRYGWSVAEGKVMYGSATEHYMVKESLSGWLWGLFLPIATLGLIGVTHGMSLVLLGGYSLTMWRVYHYRRSCGDNHKFAQIYAIFCVFSKFPQVIGQVKYWVSRILNKKSTLIEYKTSNQHAIKY